jgi:hypothetical protein
MTLGDFLCGECQSRVGASELELTSITSLRRLSTGFTPGLSNGTVNLPLYLSSS